MPRTVEGVVSMAVGEPVTMENIVIPDPGPGEAVVAIQACGVCHTDLHYREGGISNDYPFFLGHEAAGVVEEVGPDVTEVAPGDFVILNWRAVCGQCRSCLRGRPNICFSTHNAAQEDEARGRHRTVGCVGDRRLRRGDPGGRRSVHEGRSGGVRGGGRPAGMRRDGRHRRGSEHRGSGTR